MVSPTNHNPELPERRALLGALLALGAVAPLRRAAGTSPGEPRVGIQLYTVRAELNRDFDGTLRALRDIGYRELELVGLFGQELEAVRGMLDKYQLSAPSAHIFPKAAQDLMREMALGRLPEEVAWRKIDAVMQIDNLQAMITEMLPQARALGHRYLVCASMDPKLMSSVEGIGHVAAAFQQAGDLCRKNGLTFAFHPHGDDFQMVADKSAVERLLDATPPDRVSLELDFYWAAIAGVDIPRLLRHYSGRIPLAHVKDLVKGYSLHRPPAKAGEGEDHFEDVGYGQLDFKQWIPLGRRAGMRHFFFERDISSDPLGSARRSYVPLRNLLR